MAEKPAAPTLQAQVTAVELAYVNMRGSVEILQGLVAKNKRDPVLRDKMLAIYQSEQHKIDSALEVSNAVTDLVEA